MTNRTSPLSGTPRTRVPLSERPLPPVDRTIPPWPGEAEEYGGVRLHVRRAPRPDGEYTDEPTVVFVHGLGGSSTNWTDLAGQLAGYANGLAVDLPGSGRTEPPAGHLFTPAGNAEVLAGFVRGLDSTHNTGPVHLVGNSMGGATSLLFAAGYPDLVRTLTLISPAVPDLRLSPKRLSDPRLPLAFLPVVGRRVRRQLAAMSPRDRADSLMRLCFADPDSIPEQRRVEATEEAAYLASTPWAGPSLSSSTVGLMRSWLVPRSRSMWTLLPTVTAPTLVIWGTEDRLVSVRKAPRTAELLPRARLLVLPRTGHVAQMERPDTVARAMLGMWENEDTW